MADYTDEDLFEAFAKLPEYYIEIGVVSGDTERKEYVGITNAELMFIHEYGSPTNNIPARPVLQMTIDWANKELLEPAVDGAIDAVINRELDDKARDKELKNMCVRMENYARHITYDNDGRLKPNSPKVAKRKKGYHPLFDTGQLAKSITCHLVKI